MPDDLLESAFELKLLLLHTDPTVAILLYVQLFEFTSYIDPPCYPYKTTMVANEKKDFPRICIEDSTAALPGLTLLVAALRPQLADLSCDAAGTGAEILVTLILESDRKLPWNSGQACGMPGTPYP